MVELQYGVKAKVWEEIRRLAADYDVQRLILFGSRARGDYRPRSDIDLAYSGGRSGFGPAVDEETSTLLMFDVVDLDRPIDDTVRESIAREGILLYEKV